MTSKYVLVRWLPGRLLMLLCGECVLLNVIRDLQFVFLIISLVHPELYLRYGQKLDVINSSAQDCYIHIYFPC